MTYKFLLKIHKNLIKNKLKLSITMGDFLKQENLCLPKFFKAKNMGHYFSNEKNGHKKYV